MNEPLPKALADRSDALVDSLFEAMDSLGPEMVAKLQQAIKDERYAMRALSSTRAMFTFPDEGLTFETRLYRRRGDA